MALAADSGLNGRGGAQFPLGRKLQTVREQVLAGRAAAAVIVNLSEGEPPVARITPWPGCGRT